MIDMARVRAWGDFLNRRTVRPAFYETRDLPEDMWHTCPSCYGRGQVFSQGDLHRSSGIVPCGHPNCHGGVIKTETVMVRKPVYRVKARRSE